MNINPIMNLQPHPNVLQHIAQMTRQDILHLIEAQQSYRDYFDHYRKVSAPTVTLRPGSYLTCAGNRVVRIGIETRGRMYGATSQFLGLGNGMVW